MPFVKRQTVGHVIDCSHATSDDLVVVHTPQGRLALRLGQRRTLETETHRRLYVDMNLSSRHLVSDFMDEADQFFTQQLSRRRRKSYTSDMVKFFVWSDDMGLVLTQQDLTIVAWLDVEWYFKTVCSNFPITHSLRVESVEFMTRPLQP